jgi:hypothetical protein
MLTRRSLLGGLLAAPALVRLDSLDFGRPRLILPPAPPPWHSHSLYVECFDIDGRSMKQTFTVQTQSPEPPYAAIDARGEMILSDQWFPGGGNGGALQIVPPVASIEALYDHHVEA